MNAFSPSGGRKNIGCSLLNGIVEIFPSKKLTEKFQVSSLNVKEFITWALDVDAVCSQHVVAVLETKPESERAQKYSNILTATDRSLCAM